MAINFPANPTPNDVFTDGGKSWIWDGVTWKIYSSSTTGIGLGDLSVTTASVGTASLSYNSGTGVFTYTPPDLSGYITQQYTLPTASTTVLGGVKIDGTTITINNGVISGASQGASVSVSDIAPTSPNQGDLWWRSSEGRLKIRYEDGNSNQWVDAFPVLDGSTSIAVADESTDIECFPLFSTVATGDLEPKTVNSFKLNSSTGQLEAGSFKKSGGSSSEFLKADGSIDSTSYSTFSGSYTDLTNKPTLVSNLNDLGDVNTTGVANGKILKYDLSTTSWIIADDGGGSGGGGGGNVAVGSIMIWSGSVANIPTGWQLCDGTNGSPDLRDKFVIGASSDDSGVAKTNVTGSLGQSGGSKDAVVVEHKHTTNIDGRHVIPGDASSTFSYGGAGTYSSAIFNMQNEGVSGTNQNLPPYYALCYIYCTAAGSNQNFIGLDDTPISHSNGKMLQSNGSSLIWVDTPTGFSGNYNDLTNKPTLFSGSYTDLSNKPTIPSTLNDLSDVDTTGAANGKIIKYNGSSWVIADDASGGTSPGGSDTHVQFNNSSSFAGDASLTWDNTNNKFKIGNADSDSYLLVGNNSKRAELRNNNSSTYLYSYADSTFHIAAAGSGSTIQLDSVSTTMARFVKGAECALYHNNGLRFETTSDGAKIEGDIRLRRTASDDGALYFGDTNDNYIFGSDVDDVITFATSGGEKFRIGSSGQIGLSGTNYGTSGQVLTSQGSGSAPTWTTVSGGGSNVQADWNETNSGSGAFIQNKPTLFSGSYNDLSNKPTLFSGSYDDLTNKPSLFSGAYGDLTGKPTLVTTLGQLTDINITGSPADDSILQYNSSTSQWDVVSGSGIGFSGNYNDLTNKPTIPAAQVNSNWNAVSGVSLILNKPNLATVATSGNYNDLSNRPTITGGSPGGVNNSIQFNNSGSFGGTAFFSWDGTNVNLRDDYGITLGTTVGGASPLRIYHDGSNNIIHNVTDATHPGDLYLLAGNLSGGYGSHVFIVNQDHYDPPGTLPTTGVMAEFQSDGGQKLHWQGSGTKGSRLETTEYGILLKRTDTSLEGGHIQFEDIQGNSRYAIDVYGTTTSNSLLRIVDQQQGLQRFCVNKDGSFGIGHVGNEDYGTAGEVLISQGSSSQPTWGTISGGSNAVGIGLSGQSLGSSAGNQLVLAQIQATVSNASYLQFKKVRDTNGTSWDQAYTRIQQRIDVTDQGYIQFNGSDNMYGMEFGTTGDKKFAKFIEAGSAELYYDGNRKIRTTNSGITVTGSVSTEDINMSNLNGDANEVDNTKGSWSIQEGSDDLFIINRVTGKKYKFNLTEIE